MNNLNGLNLMERQAVLPCLNHMEAADLTCILPLLEEELKATLGFTSLQCLVFQRKEGASMVAVDAAPFLDLSDRQKKRLEEALCADQPFWDAVGHQVFLPIRGLSGCHSHEQGNVPAQVVLVLIGVNRLIHLEEANRWLKLLHNYAHLLIYKVFNYALTCQKYSDGLKYPPFLEYYLTGLKSYDTPVAIVHISTLAALPQKAWTAHYESPFYTRAKTVCHRLWPFLKPKYLGGDVNHAWFALLNKQQGQRIQCDILASNLRRFWQNIPITLARTLSVYLHFSLQGPPSLPFIFQTEEIARELGTHIFSSQDLFILQQRTQAEDLYSAIKHIGLTDSLKAAAFLSHHSNLPDSSLPAAHESVSALKALLPPTLQIIPTGQCSAFIVSNTESGKTFAQAIETALNSVDISDSMQPKYVLGIAYKDALRLSGLENLAFTALYAHRHASLLPETHSEAQGGISIKKAVFDGLTLHVAGDELFTMGDMISSYKMFKRALTAALKQEKKASACVVTPALLNSLGISLLQIGRRAAAISYFEQALKQFPNDIMAYYNLSSILMEMNRLDRAEDLLKRAASLTPDDINIRIRLAQVLFEKQDINSALALLTTLTSEATSELPAAFFKLQGRLGLENGNWNYAKESLQKALVRTPSDPEILLFLADGYLRFEKDSKTANRLLRQAELLTLSARLLKRISQLKKRTKDKK
jgi:Flp pilus assembly protein TadD